MLIFPRTFHLKSFFQCSTTHNHGKKRFLVSKEELSVWRCMTQFLRKSSKRTQYAGITNQNKVSTLKIQQLLQSPVVVSLQRSVAPSDVLASDKHIRNGSLICLQKQQFLQLRTIRFFVQLVNKRRYTQAVEQVFYLQKWIKIIYENILILIFFVSL